MEVLLQLTVQLAILAVANVTGAVALTAGVILAAHALRAKIEAVAVAAGLKK